GLRSPRTCTRTRARRRRPPGPRRSSRTSATASRFLPRPLRRAWSTNGTSRPSNAVVAAEAPFTFSTLPNLRLASHALWEGSRFLFRPDFAKRVILARYHWENSVGSGDVFAHAGRTEWRPRDEKRSASAIGTPAKSLVLSAGSLTCVW